MSLINLTVVIQITWIVAICVTMTSNCKARTEMILAVFYVAFVAGMLVGSIHLTAWLAAGAEVDDALRWFAFALINLPLGLRVREVYDQKYGNPAM